MKISISNIFGLLLILSVTACSKQDKEFKQNKFEVSFVSYGDEKISKYTIFASNDGKNFIPVKDITPGAQSDMQYKLQFVIPQEKLDADGTLLFYMEETSVTGSISKTEIVTVN